MRIKNDKRGLSTVVTTLIIILLVLVAIGIIWFVIQGLIEDTSGQIDLLAACPQINLKATSVSCTTGNDGTNSLCNVTVRREDTMDYDVSDVKLAFSNDTGNIYALNIGESVDGLETVTISDQPITGVSDVSEVKVYPMISGELCAQPSHTYTNIVYP